MESIDLPADRHVIRVFLRTGLVKAEANKKHYHASEMKKAVVLRARELYPKYPNWCNEDEAHCSDTNWEYGCCALSKVCTKRKRGYKVLS